MLFYGHLFWHDVVEWKDRGLEVRFPARSHSSGSMGKWLTPFEYLILHLQSKQNHSYNLKWLED